MRWAGVCVGSAHDRVARRLVDELPEGCHFFPRWALTRRILAVAVGLPARSSPRYLVVDMPHQWGGVRLVSRRLLRHARRHGYWVNVWTVDDPEEMRELLELGVGGIMTDRPDLLREAMDAVTAPPQSEQTPS